MPSQHQSKEELIKLLELLDKHEAFLERGKLARYKPHGNGPDGGQLAFHKSDAKIRCVVTGNRWGKTVCSIIECIWLANGTHPFHPIPVPNRGKLYADSFPMVMDNIFLKLKQWIPPQYLHSSKPYTYNNMGMLTGVNWANGSLTRIGSYDQEERKAEGSNWDYVGFDEPPSRELYIANLRGCVDTGGRMWFTMTPLSERWVFDDLWVPGMNGTKPFVKCFRGTPEDNPHIDKEALKMFVDELSEDEKEIRYYGHFSKLSGLVIDTYDPNLSDINPFNLTEDYVIYEGIDPHPEKDHCALWKAIDRDDNRYVVEELSCAEGIPEFGRRIASVRRRLTDNGAMLLRSVCDTSLNTREMRSRLNMKDELCRILREEGEDIMPYNADKRDNLLPTIQKLKDLYRPVLQCNSKDKDIVNDKPVPKEYIFKNCVKYKYELLHYQWPESVHDNSKPLPKFDDFIACNRYIETLTPHFQTPGSRFMQYNDGRAYQKPENSKWLRKLL